MFFIKSKLIKRGIAVASPVPGIVTGEEIFPVKISFSSTKSRYGRETIEAFVAAYPPVPSFGFLTSIFKMNEKKQKLEKQFAKKN